MPIKFSLDARTKDAITTAPSVVVKGHRLVAREDYPRNYAAAICGALGEKTAMSGGLFLASVPGKVRAVRRRRSKAARIARRHNR